MERVKKLTIAFLMLIMKMCSCEQICKYYPFYPNNTFKLILCSNGCCGGEHPLNSQDACCISLIPSWIPFLIVAIMVLITAVVCAAFLCIKCQKKRKGSQKIGQQSWETQVSGSEVINRNSSDWYQPPPKYDEIEFYKTNSQIIELNTIDKRKIQNVP